MDATAEPTVRLRLRSGLLGTAAVTSFVSTLPLFGVLYWFGVRGGTWLEVLIVHAIVVVGCFAVGLRQLTVFADGSNLTDAPWRRYIGNKNQLVERERYDYALRGGIQLHF